MVNPRTENDTYVFVIAGLFFVRVASINQDTPNCDERTDSDTAIH